MIFNENTCKFMACFFSCEGLSYADHYIHNDNEIHCSAGYGLLKFTSQFGFCHHVFYSLLKGRPVVVLGKVEKDVRSLVNTLSLFVPGYSW